MGIFTTQDVKEGEELTLDYQFERYDSAPQQCFCGSASCRGWIRGRTSESDKETKRSVRRERRRLAGSDPVTSAACGRTVELKVHESVCYRVAQLTSWGVITKANGQETGRELEGKGQQQGSRAGHGDGRGG